MILYLGSDLVKANPATGNYVGRVQTSVGADGDPIYKYFYDPKEYQQYMANKQEGAAKDTRKEDKKDDDKPKLKDKLDEEHAESKAKTSSPKEYDKDKKKVEKSLYLDLTPATFHYVRID